MVSPLLEDFSNIYLPASRRIGDQSLAETLWSLPSLLKLVVYDDGKSDTPHLSDFLRFLTPGPNLDIAVYPALQELVIKYYCSSDSSTLDAFIQKRMELSNGFRRLEIQNPNARDVISEAQIEFSRSRGLDTSIVYTGPSFGPNKPSPWVGLSQDETGSK